MRYTYLLILLGRRKSGSRSPRRGRIISGLPPATVLSLNEILSSISCLDLRRIVHITIISTLFLQELILVRIPLLLLLLLLRRLRLRLPRLLVRLLLLLCLLLCRTFRLANLGSFSTFSRASFGRDLGRCGQPRFRGTQRANGSLQIITFIITINIIFS